MGDRGKRLKILSELAGNLRAGTKAIDAAARDLEIQRIQCYELLKRYWRCPTDRGELAGRRRRWPTVFQVDGVGRGGEV